MTISQEKNSITIDLIMRICVFIYCLLACLSQHIPMYATYIRFEYVKRINIEWIFL